MIKIFFLLLFPCTIIAQQDILINITFGNYTDDQVEHKFTAKERIWHFNGKTLGYSIDVNDLRYVDTLSLTDTEIEKISRFLEKNELSESVQKEYKPNYLNKHGTCQEIKAEIFFRSKKIEISIKSDGFSKEDEDLTAKTLEDLEQLFYEITESHR
jgi:hypothetical protein